MANTESASQAQDVINFRKTLEGHVAISERGHSIVIGKDHIVAAAQLLFATAGYGEVFFYRYTALGCVNIDEGETAEFVQEVNARHERQRDEEQAFDSAWIDAHNFYDEPKDKRREAAAARQRRRRAKLKAERDAAKKCHAETVTTDQTVTGDRDRSPECHDESVTLAPTCRDRQERLIA